MNTKTYKILLVEDDKIVQEAFKRLIKNRNIPCECTVAGLVGEAQEKLASVRFDVVIADYMLGDGTALDILKLVKDTPTIVITGAGDREIIPEVMGKGACDCIVKDYEQNYLDTLHRILTDILDE